jgi:hypothetical protein
VSCLSRSEWERLAHGRLSSSSTKDSLEVRGHEFQVQPFTGKVGFFKNKCMHYTDESPMLMDYLAIFRVSLRD